MQFIIIATVIILVLFAIGAVAELRHVSRRDQER